MRSGLLQSILISQNGGLVDGKNLPTGAQLDNGQEADGQSTSESSVGSQFLKMGEKFINIENLNIDLIDAVNPFHGAYEILSKTVNAAMLKTIQQAVSAGRAQVSEEEAVILWPKIKTFQESVSARPFFKLK